MLATKCPRCGRSHSGACGIPPRVSIGGSKPIPRTTLKSSPKEAKLKMIATQRLKDMLEWGEREKQKVLDMLKVLPPDMKEYSDLLERLDKLEKTLKEIKIKLG